MGVVLAGTYPDDVRIVGVHRDHTEGVRAFVVEDRRPGRPGIVGLPKIAGRGGDEIPVPLARRHGEIGDSAGVDGRPDSSQGEPGQGVGVELGFGLVCILFGRQGNHGCKRENHENNSAQLLHVGAP